MRAVALALENVCTNRNRNSRISSVKFRFFLLQIRITLNGRSNVNAHQKFLCQMTMLWLIKVQFDRFMRNTTCVTADNFEHKIT